MTLIKSISGIRGTIGGQPGSAFTPLDIVKFTASYARWLQETTHKRRCRVVVGRDARISGEMVNALVCATLSGMGINVLDIGLATTPTTEIAVTGEGADGGIILTASHNPKEWNALKLLNGEGEFLSAQDGAVILRYAEEENFRFAGVDDLGIREVKNYTALHVHQVISLDLVEVETIRNAGFTVAFDAVNSVGGIVIPALLSALGVKKMVPINGDPTGHFAHTPEPLPENLVATCDIVKRQQVDVCFVVDPDVDRLSVICEDGSLFNEEYTLVAVADYVLSRTPGNTVSNLSSSRALRVVTEKYGASYSASAVGEVNVVATMKETGAVIGGEGNGGVIYPESHYGRDALVGIALFLTHMAKTGLKCTELRKTYPDYYISKNKIELSPGIDVDLLLSKIEKIYEKEQISTIDGLKIDFADEWVHLRKSNTEPVIRIYAESTSPENAEKLALRVISQIKNFL